MGKFFLILMKVNEAELWLKTVNEIMVHLWCQ